MSGSYSIKELECFGKSLIFLEWREQFAFWVVTFDVPAIVCHHSSVPSSLISSFHFLDVLADAFILFVANIATVSKKPVEMVMQEVDLDTHVSSHMLICIQHILYDFFKVGDSPVTKEIQYNSNETTSCVSFKWIHWKYEVLILYQFSDVGFIKDPCFKFLNTQSRERSASVFEAFTILSKAFTNCLISPNFEGGVLSYLWAQGVHL